MLVTGPAPNLPDRTVGGPETESQMEDQSHVEL